MASPSASNIQFSDDRKIWDSLKQAIANSSGFQRWMLEHADDESLRSLPLDLSVQRYLRDTLETLAY